MVSQEDETARTELANAERELEHTQSSDPAASKALHARREDIESRVLEISEGVLAAHLILCARRHKSLWVTLPRLPAATASERSAILSASSATELKRETKRRDAAAAECSRIKLLESDCKEAVAAPKREASDAKKRVTEVQPSGIPELYSNFKI